MTSQEFHHYAREEFLGEFFPDVQDRAAITVGMEQLRAEQRAYRRLEIIADFGDQRLAFTEPGTEAA